MLLCQRAMRLAKFGAWVLIAITSSTGCTIVTQQGGCAADCNGVCTDTASDPNNCGGCGLACNPGDFCQGGQCVVNGQVTCLNDGAGCTSNADCCSSVCDVTNTCASPVAGCLEDNAPCATDGDCCSGVCGPDGYCGVGACLPEGSGCNTDNDCCNPLYCDNGGCSSCVSSGNGCNVDADCCSGVCDTTGACY